MPEAFMATTTSPGPGVGSGNSRSSSLRPPRKTTPRIPASFTATLSPSLPAREAYDADDEARRGDDRPRDRDRPFVVPDLGHAARLDRRRDRRSPPLAQAALLRRANGRPRLAHPDLRRTDPAPHGRHRHGCRQRLEACLSAGLEQALETLLRRTRRSMSVA